MDGIRLDGLWSAETARAGSNEKISITTEVPGDIRKALCREGIIADPSVGLNEASSEWVGSAEWHVRRSFTLSGRKAAFYDGPEAVINGTTVEGPGDITPIVHRGENSIELNTGCVIPHGLRIFETDDYALISAETETRKTGDGIWQLEIRLRIFSTGRRTITLETELHGDAASHTLEIDGGAGTYVVSREVCSPEFWYPNGYGYPHLYQLAVSSGEWRTGALVSFRKDIRIFTKGTVWNQLPDDAGSHVYEHLVKSVAEASMNTIYSEGDVPAALREAADRYGILIRKLPVQASYEMIRILPSPPSMSSILLTAYTSHIRSPGS